MQTNNHEAREWAKQNVLSAAEVAGLLNMTRSQVARLTNCGRLKPLKYSRKNGTALYYLPDVLEYYSRGSEIFTCHNGFNFIFYHVST